MKILTIRISTVFMLDPYIPLLLRNLQEKGYVVSPVKIGPGGFSVIFIEPPNVIAAKGDTRISYDFNRRSLAIEGSIPRSVITALMDVKECLSSMDIEVSKALIPLELNAVAVARLKPRFVENMYSLMLTEDMNFSLKSVEMGLAMSDSDPNSSKWLHIRITPLWSSYRAPGEENLYEVVIVYRDDERKIIYLVENLEEALKKIIQMV